MRSGADLDDLALPEPRPGGALSSIGVSWQIYNSLFTDNSAVGFGANRARLGTPGGGNGGAICLDGNRYTLDLAGSIVRDNVGNEGGGAIFFVSNDRTGELRITESTLSHNPASVSRLPASPASSSWARARHR